MRYFKDICPVGFKIPYGRGGPQKSNSRNPIRLQRKHDVEDSTSVSLLNLAWIVKFCIIVINVNMSGAGSQINVPIARSFRNMIL